MTMQDKTPQHIVTAIIAAAAFFLVVMFLASCTSTKKAVKVLDNNPVDAAKYCAEKYPVKDSIIFKVDTVTTIDTTVMEVIEVDTIWKVYNDTVFAEIVKTLPAKTITKTVTKEKEVYRENTARVEQFKLQLTDCNNERLLAESNFEAAKEDASNFKKQRNKWRFRFFCLLGFIIGWKFLQYRYGLKF